jgi:hypothetical protein
MRLAHEHEEYRSDVWTWDGTRWTELSLSPAPPMGGWAAMVCDPVRSELMVVRVLLLASRACGEQDVDGVARGDPGVTSSAVAMGSVLVTCTPRELSHETRTPAPR